MGYCVCLGMLFTSTIMLLAQRQTGGKRGRPDICISILPQWKLRCEKFSDALWSQQRASSRTGAKIRPFLFQPGFSSPHVCPVPRTAVWILQKGYQQTSPNRIPQNSWNFLGFMNICTREMLGLLSVRC